MDGSFNSIHPSVVLFSYYYPAIITTQPNLLLSSKVANEAKAMAIEVNERDKRQELSWRPFLTFSGGKCIWTINIFLLGCITIIDQYSCSISFKPVQVEYSKWSIQILTRPWIWPRREQPMRLRPLQSNVKAWKWPRKSSQWGWGNINESVQEMVIQGWDNWDWKWRRGWGGQDQGNKNRNGLRTWQSNSQEIEMEVANTRAARGARQRQYKWIGHGPGAKAKAMKGRFLRQEFSRKWHFGNDNEGIILSVFVRWWEDLDDDGW